MDLEKREMARGGDQGFWGSPRCPGPSMACASSVKQAPPSRPGFGEIQSWNTEPLRHKESIPPVEGTS